MSLETHMAYFKPDADKNILDNKMLNLLNIPSDYNPSNPLQDLKQPKTIRCNIVPSSKRFIQLQEILHLNVQNKIIHGLVTYINDKAIQWCEEKDNNLRFPVVNLQTGEHVYLDVNNVDLKQSKPHITEIIYWNTCNNKCPLKDRTKIYIYDQFEKKINVYTPNQETGFNKLIDWYNAVPSDNNENELKVFKVRPLSDTTNDSSVLVDKLNNTEKLNNK